MKRLLIVLLMMSALPLLSVAQNASSEEVHELGEITDKLNEVKKGVLVINQFYDIGKNLRKLSLRVVVSTFEDGSKRQAVEATILKDGMGNNSASATLSLNEVEKIINTLKVIHDELNKKHDVKTEYTFFTLSGFNMKFIKDEKGFNPMQGWIMIDGRISSRIITISLSDISKIVSLFEDALIFTRQNN